MSFRRPNLFSDYFALIINGYLPKQPNNIQGVRWKFNQNARIPPGESRSGKALLDAGFSFYPNTAIEVTNDM